MHKLIGILVVCFLVGFCGPLQAQDSTAQVVALPDTINLVVAPVDTVTAAAD